MDGLLNHANPKHINSILFNHLHRRLVLHYCATPVIMIVDMRYFKPTVEIQIDLNIPDFVFFDSKC